MKSLVILATIMVVLVLIPVMAVAESAQTATATPPLSQPLVREGTLATKLADALKVGPATNEVEAESSLSAVGIAPKNGWIADYPVTPDIAGELQSSVNDAATAGRISVNKDVATKAFQDVMTSYNLSVAAGISDPASSEASAPAYPEPEVINNYYYEEGPPVVTYYAPPPDYAYLYSWVPYPFWWWDFWFPGFFVLADFHVGFHGHHGHHHGHGDREFISNHFRDSSTGRMSRIDPANRARGGTLAGVTRGWSSPSARSGAQSILTNSRTLTPASGISRWPSRGTPSVSTARTATGSGTYRSPNFTNGRSFTQNTYGTSRTYAPYSGQRRTFSQPSYRTQGNYRASMGGRSYIAPSTRSFNAPSYSGRSSGGGSFGGSRGSFSGGGLSGGRGGGSLGGWRR